MKHTSHLSREYPCNFPFRKMRIIAAMLCLLLGGCEITASFLYGNEETGQVAASVSHRFDGKTIQHLKGK